MLSLIQTGIFLMLIISVIGNSNISSASSEDTLCECKLRYLKHYVTKGCKVEQTDSCGCPTKYSCSSSSDTNEEKNVCIYQNEEYKPGSRINVTDRCISCRCSRGDQPHIVCRHKECPQLELVQNENCHPVFEKNQCCPTKYECVPKSTENEAFETGSVCVHEGVTYPVGARVYPSEDPCLICECTEDWQGVSNSSCYHQDCFLEKNKMLLDTGCIPVYHENKCCPIEFHCPENHVMKTNTHPLENDLVAETNEYANACIFEGKFHEINTELPMKNPCITCTCLIPPDFTCVHQSCPPAPSIERCEVTVSSNYCCPSYECFSENSTVNASSVVCPTPQCEDATCEIKIPEGHQCPTCVCDESTAHEKNVFESEENVLEEGSMKNTNLSGSDNFEKETLIPIETESSANSDNKSEKFVHGPSETNAFANGEVEDLELEGLTNNSERGNDTSGTDEDSSREQIDLSMEKFQGTNTDSGERDLIKILRKRSTEYQNRIIAQQQQNQIHHNQLPQQHLFDEYESDSDREILENDDGFDELKLSKKNSESRESKLNKEDLFGSASVVVPDGCPTPLCADSSCKIEIPFGHQCPTCVCKSRGNWVP